VIGRAAVLLIVNLKTIISKLKAAHKYINYPHLVVCGYCPVKGSGEKCGLIPVLSLYVFHTCKVQIKPWAGKNPSSLLLTKHLRFLDSLKTGGMASKGLRAISYRGTKKIEAGYNLLHTTETLIGYTAYVCPEW
jgi:hypothetical protein